MEEPISFHTITRTATAGSVSAAFAKSAARIAVKASIYPGLTVKNQAVVVPAAARAEATGRGRLFVHQRIGILFKQSDLVDQSPPARRATSRFSDRGVLF